MESLSLPRAEVLDLYATLSLVWCLVHGGCYLSGLASALKTCLLSACNHRGVAPLPTGRPVGGMSGFDILVPGSPESLGLAAFWSAAPALVIFSSYSLNFVIQHLNISVVFMNASYQINNNFFLVQSHLFQSLKWVVMTSGGGRWYFIGMKGKNCGARLPVFQSHLRAVGLRACHLTSPWLTVLTVNWW